MCQRIIAPRLGSLYCRTSGQGTTKRVNVRDGEDHATFPRTNTHTHASGGFARKSWRSWPGQAVNDTGSKIGGMCYEGTPEQPDDGDG